MRELGQRYVQYFNRRYKRSGTLWEGRYRSCVAESASYVLACYRYIELNPVRAYPAARSAAYVGLFEHALEPSLLDSIRKATNGGYPLGSESFKSAFLTPLGRKLEPARPGRPSKEVRKSRSDPDFRATEV